MMIVAGTGHRSEDCEDEGIVRLKVRVCLSESRPDVFICGMANGLDLWAADEARLLGIEVWAAKPWAGHGPRKGDEELYSRIENYASKVVNVVESETFPGNWCYQKRNEWMVDNATHVMAYYNGKPKGGTYNCITYAKGKKPIRNIYGWPPF